MNDNQNNIQRKNPLKIEMEQSIQERIDKYMSQETKINDYLKNDPLAPKKQKEENKINIEMEVKKLNNIFGEISPYIFKIRENVPNILAQNKLTACYFLFGKIFQSWKAVFLLAHNGFHYEVMEMMRSLEEAENMIILFMRDDDASPDLKKWFTGEVVGNEKARNEIHNFMNEGDGMIEKDKTILPINKMMAGVYSGLSKYTHLSYGALLDLFNVYTRDFDFDMTSNFYHTHKSALPYAHGKMQGTIVTIKSFYFFIKDKKSYDKIDLILKKFYPEISSKDKINKAKNVVEKFL